MRRRFEALARKRRLRHAMAINQAAGKENPLVAPILRV